MPRTTSHVACLLLSSSVAGWTQSAWLPEPRQLLVTPGFTYSTFDEFWVARDRVSPLEANDESLNQYTGFLAFEYGIAPRLAADATIGYTATSDTTTFGNDSDDGLADTALGLRYQLVEEGSWAPALALRIGAVIPGTYDENLPFSAGDGAHAFDSSILLGKRFGSTGLGAYGDFGYRVRETPVPDELFGSIGLFHQIPELFAATDALTLSVGYRHIQSLSGLDIGGAGFDPSLGAAHGFPALREINQLIEGAVGYRDGGGRQYQFTVAKSLDGRNTGDKWVFVFSVTLPFGGL